MIANTTTTLMTVSGAVMVGIFFSFSHIKELRKKAEENQVAIGKEYVKIENNIYDNLLTSLKRFSGVLFAGAVALILDELNGLTNWFNVYLFIISFMIQFLVFLYAIYNMTEVLTGLIKLTKFINRTIW